MKRITAALLLLLSIATSASALGVQGNVVNGFGVPMYPCDIDVTDRTTNTIVAGIADSTVANGNYNLVLPNGRYNIVFKPRIGSHVFQGSLIDQRVNNNTTVVNLFLPVGHYVRGKVVGTDNSGLSMTNLRPRTPANVAPVNVQDDGTNLDGTFNTLVDPGVWDFQVIPPNASHKVPRVIEGLDITAADVDLGNVVVVNGSIMTCSITDPTLFPLAGARLIVRTVPGRNKVFVPFNNTVATGVVTAVLPIGSTFDFIAVAPPGFTTSYATLTQYNVLVGATDVTLPNFALPIGRALSAHVIDGGTLANIFNADIDVDTWLPTTYPRIETPNDFTDAFGNVTVTVASGTYRITINPPVATKCLPVRINNFSVGAAGLNLGNVACPKGHWLDVHVVEEGTGLPMAGVNLDLDNIDTGVKLTTVGDITDAAGFARLVTDNAFYKLKAIPATAANDTAWSLGGMRTLTDTSITVVMPRRGVLGVGGPSVTGLRLAAPWPNPTHAGMNFAFAGRGSGRIDILDVMGRRVATPWQGELGGEQTVRWTGQDDQGRAVANGVYFARLQVGPQHSVRRLVISH